LYYFPHTRVAASRNAPEIGGKDAAEVLNAVGLLVPVLSFAPWLHTLADKAVKLGKLAKRSFRPSINSPRLKSEGLWNGFQSSSNLQKLLDEHIERSKASRLNFDYDSVPKPLRFAAPEVEDLRLGFNLYFAARYDTHDFRINPLIRGQLKSALREGGFI
jgi:hypothetical protein